MYQKCLLKTDHQGKRNWISCKNSFYFVLRCCQSIFFAAISFCTKQNLHSRTNFGPITKYQHQCHQKTSIFPDQCINGGINIRPNSSVRKVALLSSSIFGLAEQAAYCLSLIFESFSWIFSAIYGLFFPLILKNLP